MKYISNKIIREVSLFSKTIFGLAVTFLFLGCASVQVKKINNDTFELKCKESTDACQTKAYDLCGGDFDTLNEDLREDTTTHWESAPTGNGTMRVKNTEVNNTIKIRCVDKTKKSMGERE